jgi:hypothetical protein
MNSLSKITAVSILALGTALPAMAQDVSVEAGTSAGATVSTDASNMVSTEASASGAADTNFGNLVSSLQTGATVDLTAATDATVVNFVTVTSLNANGNAAALDNALDKNVDAVAKLRTDIAANEALAAKLQAAGYTAEQVVAVTTAADGSLTVYIDDRA